MGDWAKEQKQAATAGALCALFLLLSLITPWASTVLGSLNGLDAGDGQLGLVIGLASLGALAAAIFAARQSARHTLAVLAVLAGLANTAIGLYDGLNIANESASNELASAGLGPWFLFASGAAAAISAGLSWAIADKTPDWPTVAPGWHPDPHGRHQFRWWDGNHWTGHVSDEGAVSTDPAEPERP